jgi:PD-(D/E)XK nuclease superfamily protein
VTKLRLYDNTMLSDFKRCPRYFYYRHELGWTLQGKTPALAFGSAWHAAMTVVWEELNQAVSRSEPIRRQIADKAYEAFAVQWVHEGMPNPNEMTYEMEEELGPRTPNRAYEMLLAYVEERSRLMHEFSLISVEKAFAVPLDPQDDSLFYIGLIDKVVKRHGKILGIEHKTSTAYRKGGPFRSGFIDSFSPNSQVDGYLYALHLLFPGQVGGVWVDAALVHKQEEGFLFIPVERRLEHLDSWLWEVRWWIRRVEAEKYNVPATHARQDKVMQAFPKNTNSCWDFMQACPYLELCKSWTNPIGKNLPLGYEVNRWNPLSHVKGLPAELERDAGLNEAKRSEDYGRSNDA